MHGEEREVEYSTKLTQRTFTYPTISVVDVEEMVWCISILMLLVSPESVPLKDST